MTFVPHDKQKIQGKEKDALDHQYDAFLEHADQVRKNIKKDLMPTLKVSNTLPLKTEHGAE